MVAFYDLAAGWYAEVGLVGTVAVVVEADVGRTAVEVVAAMLLLQGYPIYNPSATRPTSGEHSSRLPTHQIHEGHMDTTAHLDILHGHKVSIPHSDEPRCVAPGHVNRYRSDRSTAKGVLAHGWAKAHVLQS